MAWSGVSQLHTSSTSILLVNQSSPCSSSSSCVIRFNFKTPHVLMPEFAFTGEIRARYGSRRLQRRMVVSMAPEEEKLTRRNPLDFPIEWERPKPGRRPDIFPQFSPMKTPLPQPMPCDPPDEDEEDEEEKKEEEEEKPEKEEPEEPKKET